MLPGIARPTHEKRLIPDGRFSGAMPWVMAIMLFLTLLAAAAALVVGNATAQGETDLTRQATVQLLNPDPAGRAADQRRLAKALPTMAGIVTVAAVPEAEARALLEPWLGEAARDADIPVPALIDIVFAAPPGPADLKALQSRIARIAPQSRVDTHASWLAPFLDLMASVMWVALGVLLLLLIATAATVALAVRAALNNHKTTIEIMHMMGATDLQAARLFQRRVALDALFGGVVGLSAAIIVLLLLGSRLDALQSGLLAGTGMPVYGWFVLALIPLGVTGLAMLMARWTVLSALKKML